MPEWPTTSTRRLTLGIRLTEKLTVFVLIPKSGMMHGPSGGLALAAGSPEAGLMHGLSGGLALAVWPPRARTAHRPSTRPRQSLATLIRIALGTRDAATQALGREVGTAFPSNRGRVAGPTWTTTRLRCCTHAFLAVGRHPPPRPDTPPSVVLGRGGCPSRRSAGRVPGGLICLPFLHQRVRCACGRGPSRWVVIHEPVDGGRADGVGVLRQPNGRLVARSGAAPPQEHLGPRSVARRSAASGCLARFPRKGGQLKDRGRVGAWTGVA